MSEGKIVIGGRYYDFRRNDFFIVEALTPPVNTDSDISEEDFKDYVLAEWFAINTGRYILRYDSGKTDTCRDSWIIYHEQAGQYKLQN